MAKRKSAAGAAAPSFEEALARLEAIVRELEEEDLPLERSLAVFEEGVRLSRLLHERLNAAERTVEVLMKNEQGEKVPVPFAAEGAPAAQASPPPAEDEVDEEDEEEPSGSEGGHGQSALPF